MGSVGIKSSPEGQLVLHRVVSSGRDDCCNFLEIFPDQLRSSGIRLEGKRSG